MRLKQLAMALALTSALGAFAVAPSSARACTTTYTVNLQNQTAGSTTNGVLVELRQGVPGHSTIVTTQRSSGGSAYFTNLCAGTYFLAIGDGDNVQVTPSHQFADNYTYTSTITLITGPGNVTNKSRKSL
jgi:hypothetical protein